MSKHRIGDPKFALSIQMEGLPRSVGPFDDREAAFEWARDNVGGPGLEGSYHAFPIVSPEDIQKKSSNVIPFRRRNRA